MELYPTEIVPGRVICARMFAAKSCSETPSSSAFCGVMPVMRQEVGSGR